ncbi:methyltransferase [Streptomyces aureus]
MTSRPRPQPAPALDAGCGDGSLARRIAWLGHRTTGVDCSPSAIAPAAAQDPGHGHKPLWRCVDITTGDHGALPEPARTVVTCRLAYRWIDHEPAFLSRVRHLLAGAGPSGWPPRSRPRLGGDAHGGLVHRPHRRPRRRAPLTPACPTIRGRAW